MNRRSVVLAVAAVLAACQDSPLKPDRFSKLDPNLAAGGIPGPPPHVITPRPPGPSPRVPVPLPPQAGGPSFLTNVVAIGSGNQFSCALRSDGVAYCWGANGSGQLGNGGYAPSSAAGEVIGPERFV